MMLNPYEYKLRLKHCSPYKKDRFLKENTLYKARFKDMTTGEADGNANGGGVQLPWFIMTTDGEDLEGDRIFQAGLDTNFLVEHGSVLWGHRADHPDFTLGDIANIKREEHRTLVQVRFADEADNPIAARVSRLVAKNIISGMSIGFMIRECDVSEDREGFLPLDIWKSEAIETSITPIPCNPQAVVLRDLDLEEKKDLIEIMERTVEETPAGRDEAIKATVLETTKSLTGNKVWSISDATVEDIQRAFVTAFIGS